MPPKPDPAILEALNLNASSTTTISSHGGSNFSSTFKLTTRDADADGKERLYFVKIGKGRESVGMFEGEHASLTALHGAIPGLSICPQSYATGKLSDGSGGFLVTDFITLASHSSFSSLSSSSKSRAGKGTSLSLAAKLAQLHSVPAPVPEGFSKPQFGFPVPTYCGDTVQDNTYRSSWAEFYAENRLKGVLREGEGRHGVDAGLRKLVERTAEEVVPRLLRDGHLTSPSEEPIVPVVVHGDLWSGNHGRGVLSGGKGDSNAQRDGDRDAEGAVEELIFDPAASYAHSEFEWGIMRMFGGFEGSFEREYHALKGKDKPVEEWEDRVRLYELYHHLNHYSIFGGSYKSGAVAIMRELLGKYGDGAENQ